MMSPMMKTRTRMKRTKKKTRKKNLRRRRMIYYGCVSAFVFLVLDQNKKQILIQTTDN